MFELIKEYFTNRENEEDKELETKRILEQGLHSRSPCPGVYFPDQDSIIHCEQTQPQHNAIGKCREYPTLYDRSHCNIGCSREKNMEKPKESTVTYTLKYMGRLAGLWFVTVAAGSVLCSIPVSALGLPVILSLGFTSLLVASLFSWFYHLLIKIIAIAWKAIKLLLASPAIIIRNAVFYLKKAAMSIFSISTDQQPVISTQRRFSTASRLTNRSDEFYPSRWRYYEPYDSLRIGYSNTYNGPTSAAIDYSPTFSNAPASVLSGVGEKLSIRRGVINPQFLLLNAAQKDRLEFCKQLYAASINAPQHTFDLTLGENPIDGSEHSILSLWDEPDVNCPLDSSNLIGFCEYFVYTDKPNIIHIDKLNISSFYSEISIKCLIPGYSKLLVRKIMYFPGVQAIQVWSVWHAEAFYKSLGFRNVVDSSEIKKEGRKRTRIIGELGPLLMWTMDQRGRDRDSASNLSMYEHGSNLSRNESIVSSKTIECTNSMNTYSLKSKDSMLTVVAHSENN